MVARIDSRTNDEIRPTQITSRYQSFAEGSALIEMGLTRVVCTATIEERVPNFLRGESKGWVTAEYGMLPRSTLSRTSRDNNTRGRAQEIQRLIGRALRAVTDLQGLGERTFILDCDVLQADGGTRTAAITGAYVALYQSLLNLVDKKVIPTMPLRHAVAAVSVGLVNGEPLLDLCYAEDARADVDFNVVMTGTGELVEIQGAAEGKPFSRVTMDSMLTIAENGIRQILISQQEAIDALHKP